MKSKEDKIFNEVAEELSDISQEIIDIFNEKKLPLPKGATVLACLLNYLLNEEMEMGDTDLVKELNHFIPAGIKCMEFYKLKNEKLN
jgi:hypothetical protein